MVGGRWRRAVYSQRLNTHTENVLELQHFEDLPLGEEWTTRRRTVTEADVVAFVGLAGDYNPLYADLEHARSGPYGGPVAPGALVAALTTGLGSMDVPLPATVGMVGMSWKFLAPVQPGDTLGSRWRLSRKRNVENPRWGLAVWQVEVENQRGELVASGEVARLIAKREQPAERPTGRSRRRRRKGAPAGQAAADVVMAEPVPEPAPADLPPPSARRRRGRGAAEPAAEVFESGETAEAVVQQPGAPSPFDTPPPAAGDQGGAPTEPTPSKRRRRRRSSNGQGSGGEGPGGGQPAGGTEGQGGGQPEAGTESQGGASEREGGRPAEVPVETASPPAPQPGWSSEPRPSPFSGAAPDARPAPETAPEPRPWPVEEDPAGDREGGSPDSGGLGGVFRRLRRP